VETTTISILISCLALFISIVSIGISILNYKKDRWKLSLEARIRIEKMLVPDGAQTGRGRLFLKAANIGRRALTIEKIFLQVFSDEIEELRSTPLVEVSSIEQIGTVAFFRTITPNRFPIQLAENEPITAQAILVCGDPVKLESRRDDASFL
jgi:hypothetical protein